MLYVCSGAIRQSHGLQAHCFHTLYVVICVVTVDHYESALHYSQNIILLQILYPFISPATVTASVRQRVTCCGSPSTVWNSMPWVSRFTWAKSMICLYKPTHNHSIFNAKTQKQSRALIFFLGGGGLFSTLFCYFTKFRPSINYSYVPI